MAQRRKAVQEAVTQDAVQGYTFQHHPTNFSTPSAFEKVRRRRQLSEGNVESNSFIHLTLKKKFNIK